MEPSIPLWSIALLVEPRAIREGVARARRAGLIDEEPNLWQLALGVLRMWQRVLFRSETVGTSSARVRPTWRARLLHHRALRLPFLLAERAIAPLDFTGLVSTRARIIRHLLGAHHDGDQFIYDLEILSCHEGGLAELVRAVEELLANDGPRTRWLRDLTVFEGYHESLADCARSALAHGVRVRAEAADDPDLYFSAFLRWCSRQPTTPLATARSLASGEFSLEKGLAC